MVKYKRGQLLKPEPLMIKNISLINSLHPDYLLIVDNSSNDFCEIMLIFKKEPYTLVSKIEINGNTYYVKADKTYVLRNNLFEIFKIDNQAENLSTKQVEELLSFSKRKLLNKTLKRHNYTDKKNSNKSNIKLNKRRKKCINHLKGVEKNMTVSNDNYLEEREKSQKIYKSKMYYALKYPYQDGSMK